MEVFIRCRLSHYPMAELYDLRDLSFLPAGGLLISRGLDCYPNNKGGGQLTFVRM